MNLQHPEDQQQYNDILDNTNAGTEALKENHIDLGQVSSNQEEYRRMCVELGKEGGTFEVTVKQYNDLKEYYDTRK